MIGYKIVAAGTLDTWVLVIASAEMLILLAVTFVVSSRVRKHMGDVNTAVGRFNLSDHAIANLKGLLESSGETIKRLTDLSTDLRRMERSANFSAVIYTVVGVILGIMAGLASKWIVDGPGNVLHAPFLKNRAAILRGLEVSVAAAIIASLFALVLLLGGWIIRHLRHGRRKPILNAKSDQSQVAGPAT